MSESFLLTTLQCLFPMSANDAKRTSPSIRLTGLMKRRPRLFRLNVRSLDDLAPLLGLIRDKFFKVGGRTTGHNAPCCANRDCISGVARAALISLLSLVTISPGVFLGAPRPNQ